MSQPTKPSDLFDVRVVKFDGQYWLEIHYYGSIDPPWWSREQQSAVTQKTRAALAAARGIAGVESAHYSSVSSSQILRIILIPTQGAVEGQIEAAARRVVLPVLAA